MVHESKSFSALNGGSEEVEGKNICDVQLGVKVKVIMCLLS